MRRSASLSVKHVQEQIPNRASRVVLSAQRDRLGSRSADLDWRVSPADKHAAARSYALLDGAGLRAAGIGRVIESRRLDEGPDWPDDLRGARHHMGTTRIARGCDARRGRRRLPRPWRGQPLRRGELGLPDVGHRQPHAHDRRPRPPPRRAPGVGRALTTRPPSLASGRTLSRGEVRDREATSDEHDGSHEVLARARRRPHPVRRVPARVQAARRPARALLRPRPRGRPDRAHDLRPVERVLRRPDREEAAQPLPARHVGALVRHRRLQPRLPVLPELGHLEVEGDRHARRRGRRPRRIADGRGASSAAGASRSPTTTR